MNSEEYGQTLRDYRIAAGISQAQLGRLVDMNHSYISRLEAGERLPSRETAERIATALGHGPESPTYGALLYAAGFRTAGTLPPTTPNEVLEFARLLDDATPETRAHMLATIEFFNVVLRRTPTSVPEPINFREAIFSLNRETGE